MIKTAFYNLCNWYGPLFLCIGTIIAVLVIGYAIIFQVSFNIHCSFVVHNNVFLVYLLFHVISQFTSQFALVSHWKSATLSAFLPARVMDAWRILNKYCWSLLRFFLSTWSSWPILWNFKIYNSFHNIYRSWLFQHCMLKFPGYSINPICFNFKLSVIVELFSHQKVFLLYIIFLLVWAYCNCNPFTSNFFHCFCWIVFGLVHVHVVKQDSQHWWEYLIFLLLL